MTQKNDIPTQASLPVRKKLPDERQAITHKFSIAGHEGYITVGLYEDGTPGEIFLTMAKEGSTISGLMDAFAIAISLTLQYGVPLEALVEKFSHMRFEPSGYTKNPEIPIAKSLVDYVFRWLATMFLMADQKEKVGVVSVNPAVVPVSELYRLDENAPNCFGCGTQMHRGMNHYKCLSCGAMANVRPGSRYDQC